MLTVTSDNHKTVHSVPWDDLQSEHGYKPLQVYNRTKLMNIWFTQALATSLANTAITANCASPGFVRTRLAATPPASLPSSSGWQHRSSPRPTLRRPPFLTSPPHPRCPGRRAATTASPDAPNPAAWPTTRKPHRDSGRSAPN